jgi:hypothetical protein
MADLTPLRRRPIEDMATRNLSLATQQSYVHAVAKFSRFFSCSPNQLDLDETNLIVVVLFFKRLANSRITRQSLAASCDRSKAVNMIVIVRLLLRENRRLLG